MTATPAPRFSFKQLLAVAVGVMLLTALGTALAIKLWLQPFKPVQLNEQEKQQLTQKLEQLEITARPAPYSEAGESREIILTEREINGLLAQNSDWAEKMTVVFSDNLVSLRLLLPLDPDLPLLGGKTLRLRAGVELAFRHGRPMAILKGISIMGVPLPNAWLGELKNMDLMQEVGGQPGLWQSFGAGLESLHVQEGELHLKLKE